MPRTRAPLHCFLPLFIVFLVAPATSSAQSPLRDAEQEGGTQTIQTLLAEVRQLRLALQHANTSAVRVQIAFERMRLQLGRVDALTRDLESVRSQLLNMRSFHTETAERAKDLEEQVERATDDTRKPALERQLKLMKSSLNTQAKREEQMRERETQLSAQLQVEQVKLGDLEMRLGELEREVVARQFP